jgi:hypothetical protein
MRNEAGIALPDAAQTSGCPYADIVAYGPSCKIARIGLRVIVAGGATAWNLPYQGKKDHFLVREGDLFGVINPPAGLMEQAAQLFNEYNISLSGDAPALHQDQVGGT